MYATAYKMGPADKVLLGAPRYVRADEWAYETPTIFNEVLRADPFAFKHSYVGDHNTALITNLPVRHFSSFFRPQLWGFFILPLPYAFAAYWQMKALLLVGGLFLLILMVARSTVWAIGGSLWFFFSSCTQWCYSWSDGLPEMVGLLCFCVVLAGYLIVGSRPAALILAAGALVACGLNLGMCAYLPHLVPLAIAGGAIFIGWALAQRQWALRPQGLTLRAAAVTAAILITAAGAWLLYKKIRVVIAVIGQTEYPGSRVYAGENFPMWALVSHFFAWSENETHFPAMLGNICEGSGFLWLAPVTLFVASRLMLTRIQEFALVACWTAFAILFCWMVFPVPSSVGHLLLLDRAGGSRLLPALGLLNVIIVCITMSSARLKSSRKNAVVRWASQILGVFLAVFSFLSVANTALGSFFKWQELLLATALTTLSMTLLLQGKSAWLAAVLVVTHAFAFGAVNPIQSGISIVTESPLYRLFRSRPELIRGKWLVYSGWHGTPGYLTAIGADVYTGMHFVPDIDHTKQLLEAGLQMKVMNRACILSAIPVPPGVKTSAEAPTPGQIVWKVNPEDPLLKKLGITHVAFDQQPSPEVVAHLIPIHQGPVTGIWLYRLP